jgi:sugar O-acyltransferase (sialic acid O-acetyltransferase NeuD family)
MIEEIIILGTGGHAAVVIDIIESAGKYKILGITDISSPKGATFKNYPILGNDDVLKEYFENGCKNVAIGVGGFKNNTLRSTIFKKMKEIGFRIPYHIHPSANVSKTVKIGEGTVIFPGVNINTDVSIGKNNIIATGSNIDHNTILHDDVLISAGVTLGGDVIISEKVLCALGCNVISGVEIGKEILIGAGALVVKNLYQKGKYIGIPATLSLKNI